MVPTGTLRLLNFNQVSIFLTLRRLEALTLQTEFRKILVIKPSSLGDIVHSLPFLDSLKRRFPFAEVHWVVARGFHGLLKDHPLVDRLWIIDKDRWKDLSRTPESLRELRELLRSLKAERFDIAVDLQGLFRSALIAYAVRPAPRVGFKEAKELSWLFYTHKIAGGEKIHAVDRYLKLAFFLGCDLDNLSFPFPPLPEDSPIIKSLPEEYVVIAPSAGKEANRWPAERFGELASRLPLRSVIISSKGDAFLSEKVLRASRGKAISLAGKTNLLELVDVIRHAIFFVSNDTGPMHIASALNVPVFAIFGPANPVRTGPYGADHTIIREDIACSPCYRKRKCRDWECMELLTVKRVYRTIMEKMAKMR